MADIIRPKDFLNYEACILSGQVPMENVPKLLDENPEFQKWYLARHRAQRPPG